MYFSEIFHVSFFTSICGCAVINPWQQLVSAFSIFPLNFEKGETDIYNKLLSHYKTHGANLVFRMNFPLCHPALFIVPTMATIPSGIINFYPNSFIFPRKRKILLKSWPRKKYLELNCSPLSTDNPHLYWHPLPHILLKLKLFSESSPLWIGYTVLNPFHRIKSMDECWFWIQYQIPEQRILKSCFRSDGPFKLSNWLQHFCIPMNALCLKLPCTLISRFVILKQRHFYY